jgi:O-antigen/teichoic acid export membrane protein
MCRQFHAAWPYWLDFVLDFGGPIRFLSQGCSQSRGRPLTKSLENKPAFFRQSGWLMIATTLGGVFMYAVHMVANPASIGSAEYGVFTCLLQGLNLLGIPASGLQTVFAQQTAAAVTEERRRHLAATLRGVAAGTFIFWCVCAAGTAVFQNALARTLQLPGMAPLWITLFLGLFALWLPMTWGVLQGKQDFTWYGITTFLNGFTRFSMGALRGGLLAGGGGRRLRCRARLV